MKRQSTLIVSYACNLNCIYCYERYKSSNLMEIAVAKSILDAEFKYMEESNKFDSLEFVFMGGEPLLNYDLIVNLCEWTWERYKARNYSFVVVTNGTLLDDKMKKWFSLNKGRIMIDLSVDGYSEIQFMNRGTKLQDIPIKWVNDNWPESDFKMTISRSSLPYFAKGVIYLHSHNYKVLTTLAVGEKWTNEDAIIYYNQIRELSSYYLSQKNKFPPSFLLKSIDVLFEQKYAKRKCCHSGDSVVTYDINGDKYPCTIFTPLVFGRDIREELLNYDFNDDSQFFDSRCSRCIIYNLCKTCYGYNFKERGCLAKRDMAVCKMYKTEIYAICQFQKELLERVSGHRNLTFSENVRLEHILKIIENIELKI